MGGVDEKKQRRDRGSSTESKEMGGALPQEALPY